VAVSLTPNTDNGFNVDLDQYFKTNGNPHPGRQTNADPDPGHASPSQKFYFYLKKTGIQYFM
jgi:hypothetical protein